MEQGKLTRYWVDAHVLGLLKLQGLERNVSVPEKFQSLNKMAKEKNACSLQPLQSPPKFTAHIYLPLCLRDQRPVHVSFFVSVPYQMQDSQGGAAPLSMSHHHRSFIHHHQTQEWTHPRTLISWMKEQLSSSEESNALVTTILFGGVGFCQPQGAPWNFKTIT